MSSAGLDAPLPLVLPDLGRRRIRLAPLGWHTRYRLRAYLQHAFVVAIGLVAIALAIDIAPDMPRLLAAQGDSGWVATALRIAHFAVLRTADLLPRFLPFACFLGTLSAELVHTWSRERIVVWTSGRSPAQCLVPALLFGLLMGCLQFAGDGFLRPAAIAAQVSQRLGALGEQFSARGISAPVWLSIGTDLVETRIDYGPPAVLRDLKIFRLDTDGHLVEVDSARSATPLPEAGRWLLHGAMTWHAAGSTVEASAARGEAADRPVSLGLDPLWLGSFGVNPDYLPLETLRALAKPSGGAYFAGLFQTELQTRYAQALLPGGMALLAASLSLLLLGYRVRIDAMLGIILAGYAAHLAMRVFVLLGQQGYVAPVPAAWLVPVLLLAASAGLVGASEYRRRVRERAVSAGAAVSRTNFPHGGGRH
jgi:lipopolysaccharide export LptBFGC system permease protein LptF